MKKRVGLLLVIVVLAWALVACGGGGNNDNAVDGGFVEPTTGGEGRQRSSARRRTWAGTAKWRRWPPSNRSAGCLTRVWRVTKQKRGSRGPRFLILVVATTALTLRQRPSKAFSAPCTTACVCPSGSSAGSQSETDTATTRSVAARVRSTSRTVSAAGPPGAG